MAGISITHNFVSLKGNGTDNTQVQPSNWNDQHSFQMDSGFVLGRTAAGYGAVTEIAISAYMASLLATADAPTLAGVLGLFQTGDVKYTFQSGASTGWIQLATGADTIGNAASGANLRANADTLNLFTLLWNNCTNAIAPVSTGRGASAVADFNANKTITIPSLVGRVPVGAGAATSWTTVMTFATAGGEQNHLLTTTEMPSHYHSAAIYDPTHAHTFTAPGAPLQGGASNSNIPVNSLGYTTSYNPTGVQVTSNNGNTTTYSAGGGGGHNNMQPYMPLNVWIKL